MMLTYRRTVCLHGEANFRPGTNYSRPTASEGQKGMKKAKGYYNGRRGECGPRLPDEGRAAGGPRAANAGLYPPCPFSNAASRRRAGAVVVFLAAVVAF